MIQKLYTVYDEKAQAYLPPFFVPTDGLATRAFKDCVNSADHQFGKHPSDYTLFFLGEFTDHDGQFALTDRKSMGNGVEYLEPKNPLSENNRPQVPDSELARTTPIPTSEAKTDEIDPVAQLRANQERGNSS